MITQNEVTALIMPLTEPQLDTMRSAFFVSSFQGQIVPTKRREVNQGLFWITRGYMQSLKAFERRGIVERRVDSEGEAFFVLTPLGWRVAYELGLLEQGEWVVTDDGYMMQLTQTPFNGAKGVDIIRRDSGYALRLGSPIMLEGVIYWQCWDVTPGSDPVNLTANDLRSWVAFGVSNYFTGSNGGTVPGDRAFSIPLEQVVSATYTLNRATNRRHFWLKMSDDSMIYVHDWDNDYADLYAVFTDPVRWFIYADSFDGTEYRPDAGRSKNNPLLKALDNTPTIIKTSKHFYLFDEQNRVTDMIHIDDPRAHVVLFALKGAEWHKWFINAMVSVYSNEPFCMAGYNQTPLASVYILATGATKITIQERGLIIGYRQDGSQAFSLSNGGLFNYEAVKAALIALLRYGEWSYSKHDEQGQVVSYLRPDRWEYFLPLIGGIYA